MHVGPAASQGIIDVTAEVTRDYWNNDSDIPNSPSIANSASRITTQTPRRDRENQWNLLNTETSHVSLRENDRELTESNVEDSVVLDRANPIVYSPHGRHLQSDTGSGISPGTFETLKSVAAGLLNLGRSLPVSEVTNIAEAQVYLGNAPLPVTISHDLSTNSSTTEDIQQDGVFVPGSAYFEAHSALRNHTFHAARSCFPTRRGTPRESSVDDDWHHPDARTFPVYPSNTLVIGGGEGLSVPGAPFDGLTPQEEHELWRNWVDEIAPWLDKFDNRRHFGHFLPTLAQEHSHLRFAMLALSARQLERKHPERSLKSLDLYQEAIHQLVPQLQTRSTTVVTSCVVLCVLEMMSCAPEMWRQHLDGCASLIESSGINGLSGGSEQAVFWCFARMDLCGALISDERTIIPIKRWLPSPTLTINVASISTNFGYDMYANYVVHLCAQVMDLFISDLGSLEYTQKWTEMFTEIYTYELVERETGWGAKWRADDLQAFWGDLSGD
ncbi:hypothetical protein TruAng_011819 [Truncatella angustata]|nr:hypothetical protein TruAng_011819 [Truncatella angustata]